MKNNLPPKVVRTRGITLIELTVVIVILLSIVSLLAIGANAWKRASCRSTCLMNMRNLQVATRSYQNLYGYYFGGQPQTEYGTQDIGHHLFEKGYISRNLYDQAKGEVACAGGGNYSASAPAVFPMPGDLYMKCSLAGSEKHQPENTAAW
jgi:type II secretory pathway pseudopilin PulG